MQEIIRELIGREVTVYSGESGGYRDDGILESADERWIKVRDKKGHILFFSVANVRLLKLEETH